MGVSRMGWRPLMNGVFIRTPVEYLRRLGTFCFFFNHVFGIIPETGITACRALMEIKIVHVLLTHDSRGVVREDGPTR